MRRDMIGVMSCCGNPLVAGGGHGIGCKRYSNGSVERAPMSIFLLMADSDGSMRSRPESLGVAVRTKEEAERFLRWAKGRNYFYAVSYQEIPEPFVFNTFQEALESSVRRCGGNPSLLGFGADTGESDDKLSRSL
jgi:hypothetical protein